MQQQHEQENDHLGQLREALWDQILEQAEALEEAEKEVADEHMSLCHSDGSECEDGCDASPILR